MHLNMYIYFPTLVMTAFMDFRIGDKPECARCEYPVHEGFDVCPECGNALDWDNGTGYKVGRPWRRRARLIAAGVSLLLVVVYLILLVIIT